MPGLELEIDEWLPSSDADPLARATMASLRISVDGLSLTEVHDRAAKTVRQHIHVPASLVAEWLVMNWWRLRWEPTPERWNSRWAEAHSMAAIGEGYAWPDLSISSDGVFVRLDMPAEQTYDLAGIRYMTDLTTEIPASQFERSVDDFLSTVESRVSASRCGEHRLRELIRELRAERNAEDFSRASRRCRLSPLWDP